MTILMWDKPRQKMSKAQWKENVGFEDGPTGGYQPNMAEDDARRWKAKVVGTKTGFPQVEIRKQAGSSLMTMVINLGDGYNYKYYHALPKELGKYHEQVGGSRSWLKNYEDADYMDLRGGDTPGVNVHISMNGPSTFTFEEMAEMSLVIEEAKAKLESLIGPGERRPFVAYCNDPEEVGKAVDTIEGAKFHYALKHLKVVVFTATANAMVDVVGLAGVNEVFTKADAEEREEAAHKKRMGYNR